MRIHSLLSFFVFVVCWNVGTSGILPEEWDANYHTVVDTIPITDPDGDFLTDPNTNPFDIKPGNIKQEVEYDPVTNQYILTEKIGDEFFRAPSYMTFEEYVEWKNKQQEREYFEKLAGIDSGYKSKSGILDPVEKIDVQDQLVDRLFGGTTVDLQPQGNIDLTIGWDYSRTENPNLLESQKTNSGLDFDMDIKMNVDGQIGEKMKIGFNYDTQATFDFDRKIKLAYDTQDFSDDAIVKTIEAGNVSLPLRGSLIQGAQSLFGLKTELQFGRLRLTGIASQQKSKNQSLNIQNGSSETEFFIRPDQYDENRHFFISHFHRATYERSLNNLPYINTSFKINKIQVWISDDRADYQENSTMICALSDLAEPEDTLFSNGNPLNLIEPNDPFDAIFTTGLIDQNGREIILPDNRVNTLYSESGLELDEEWRQKDRIASELKGSPFFMSQTRDFEVFRGRLLNPSEYTFNRELGFISLNVRLQPNQVLSVAYDYYYLDNCEEVYQVGEFPEDAALSQSQEDEDGNITVDPERVIYTKMLKSSNQRVDLPAWNLMMKNVYALNTSSLRQGDFEFDIYYENDAQDASLIKYIPEEGVRNVPLLNLFQLDRLNNFGDPQPDGVFDFVPGVTVVERNGSIIFPVLEPFGESIEELLIDAGLAPERVDFYRYNELYDTTVVIARQEFLEKNKFVMRGKSKSGSSSEISLGAWNLPQGSVRVTAAGRTLVEGVDYEVDYGIGRLRVLDPALIQSGAPLNVTFEDNSVFSLQQKTMLGLRADYEVSEKLNLGATYLRLFERPFTQKVNFGDDPINNRIFGLDLNYGTESDAITRIVDKLPLYSTKEPSTFNFQAEFAAIKPGHSGAINVTGEDDNGGGVVSIDDFEGAVSGFQLGSQNNIWSLASTPENFPGGNLENDLAYGANRADISWYIVDRATRTAEDNADPYSRRISQTELFNRDLPQGVLQDLFTFDVNYEPTKRGPYNFERPEGYAGVSAGLEDNADADGELILKDPESRWAGIMRYFPNNDFQAVNYESIEFWMLNPFMNSRDKVHEATEDGEIIFHLGNVSEDILNDNQQFFENTIPVDGQEAPSQSTAWGEVPLIVPTNDAFDVNNRNAQDLGLDGLNDSQEAMKYDDWITAVLSIPNVDVSDPSNDNFIYFNNPMVYDDTNTLFEKFSKFNNPEGNAPEGDQNETGNPYPDSEDLNNNRSLDEGESYYEYRINIKNTNGAIDWRNDPNTFITDERPVDTDQGEELWYRFEIPLNQGDAIGGIQGFRSIQFIRMLFTKFATNKTFRFAEFELVRNQWRRQVVDCSVDGGDDPNFTIDDIGKEENSNKEPFGYIEPRGIIQERLFSTFSTVLQDENSLALNFCDWRDTCVRAMTKLTEIDLRVFDNLEMFVHAEDALGANNVNLQDGDISAFIRFGKDFKNNYYEYEIPLVVSQPGEPADLDYPDQVWRPENKFDFPLEVFIELKKERARRGFPTSEIYDELTFADVLPNHPEAGIKNDQVVKMIGNPNLAQVKGFMIGIRRNNPDAPESCGQVWVNELRVSGLLERGGVAGLARMDLQLADLGTLAASGSYSSIGFGALDQKLDQRQKDERIDYDLSGSLELGKFTPSHWNLSIPFYAQYSKSIIQNEFDPYDRDLRIDEKVEIDPTNEDEIRDRSKEETTIRSFNFTNVRKSRSTKAPSSRGNSSKGQGKNKGKSNSKPSGPKPWDLENLSATYAYSETVRKDFLIREDKSQDYKVGLYYDYSRRANFIQPFKKVKSKYLKFIKEFNFNLLPQSFSFGSEINRFKNVREYREPIDPFLFVFNDQRFDWSREYDLKWDFTKALKMSFSATHKSVIDEYRQIGIAPDADSRMWVDENGDEVLQDVNDTQLRADMAKDYWMDNLKDFGRAKDYDHRMKLTYNVPLKNFPGLDWISLKAGYDAQYTWAGGGLVEIAPDELIGNIIQNSQERSLNAGFSFDKLYSKIGYFKRLEGKNRKQTRRTSRTRGSDGQALSKDAADKSEKKKPKNTNASFIEKLLLRPLLSIRKIDVTYKETFQTTIPGFMVAPEYLGSSGGFEAPGLGFTFGLQPDLTPNDSNNWLFQAADKGWLNTSTGFNKEITQMNRQNYDAKIKLEPWKDVKIDLTFKKNYTNDNSQYFRVKDTSTGFQQFGYNEFGSFEVSYFTLGTLFKGSEQQIADLFTEFETNRSTISQNIKDINPEIPEDEHTQDGQAFAFGYGQLSADVLVPAFLAAYTGADVNAYDVAEDLETAVSSSSYIPKPNWRLNYNGLSKLAMFKDIFSSFSIEHGYSNTLRVARFNTDPNYDFESRFDLTSINEKTGNYYSRLEIPNVSINERFDPIIGISLKTKNDALFDFKWSKTRSLDLSIIAEELKEIRKTEFVLGFGYTFEGVNIGFLTGDKPDKRGRRSRKSQEEEAEDNDADRRGSGGSVTDNRGRALTFAVDFRFSDDVTYRNGIGDNQDQQPARGTQNITLSPYVDYQVNKDFTLRMFVDYGRVTPKTSLGFPRTTINGGFTMRFNLN